MLKKQGGLLTATLVKTGNPTEQKLFFEMNGGKERKRRMFSAF